MLGASGWFGVPELRSGSRVKVTSRIGQVVTVRERLGWVNDKGDKVTGQYT